MSIFCCLPRGIIFYCYVITLHGSSFLLSVSLCLPNLNGCSSFSPQSSLTKFAESLQEMINYHTVWCYCHVKADVRSFFPPIWQQGSNKLGDDWLEQLFNCQSFGFTAGEDSSSLEDSECVPESLGTLVWVKVYKKCSTKTSKCLWARHLTPTVIVVLLRCRMCLYWVVPGWVNMWSRTLLGAFLCFQKILSLIKNVPKSNPWIKCKNVLFFFFNHDSNVKHSSGISCHLRIKPKPDCVSCK